MRKVSQLGSQHSIVPGEARFQGFYISRNLRLYTFLQPKIKMVVGRKWVMKRWVDGMPSKDDFDIVSEELGNCGDGEVIFEALFCSVDPYQRAYSRRMQPPFTMFGFQGSK